MGNTISTRSNVKNSGLGFHPPAPVQPHRLLKYSSTSLLDSPQRPAPSPNTHPARHHSLSPTRPPLDLTTKEFMPGPAENPRGCFDWLVCASFQWLSIGNITPEQTPPIFTEHEPSM